MILFVLFELWDKFLAGQHGIIAAKKLYAYCVTSLYNSIVEYTILSLAIF